MAKTCSLSLLGIQLELQQVSQKPGRQALHHHGHGHHHHCGTSQREGSPLLTGKRRRQEFLARKVSADDVKKEAEKSDDNVDEVTIENPVDEIELSEIPKRAQNEAFVDELFKIEGEYKDPKFKPWTNVEPEKHVKILWDMLEADNKAKGIEEIGEGSTCFEHCFEFWGTWKVKKEGITVDFLKNSENWPKGIKITEVKPA